MDSKIVELQTIADRDFQLDDKALRKAEAGVTRDISGFSCQLWIKNTPNGCLIGGLPFKYHIVTIGGVPCEYTMVH